MYLFMFTFVFILIFIVIIIIISQRLEVFNNLTHQTPPPATPPPAPHDFAFRYSLLKVLLAGRKLVTSAWLAGYLDECP